MKYVGDGAAMYRIIFFALLSVDLCVWGGGVRIGGKGVILEVADGSV